MVSGKSPTVVYNTFEDVHACTILFRWLHFFPTPTHNLDRVRAWGHVEVRKFVPVGMMGPPPPRWRGTIPIREHSVDQLSYGLIDLAFAPLNHALPYGWAFAALPE